MSLSSSRVSLYGYGDQVGTTSPRATVIQIALSVFLGVGAFLSFCVLRPRWKSLYSARKRHMRDDTLPELSDSLFGWLPQLWSINEDQVVASAGLDAYVLLQFFKMAITFLVVTLFFAVAVIKPVHDKFPDSGNDLQPGAYMRASSPTSPTSPLSASSMHFGEDSRTDYLWMYLVFVYLFSALAAYLIVSGTRKVIGIRQEYLGKQTTITDRTFRLSGIPRDMRTEESIKEFVEGLRIGKVSEVCLCKDWHELEAVLASRAAVLRKLEESLTVASNRRTVERNRESLPISQPLPPDLAAEDADDTDSTRLLNGHSDTGEIPDLLCRPTTRLWYGPLKLRSKKVDAIDHYEAQLQALNIKIEDLRHHRYTPSPLAFVTMESVASCQMAIQAVLSPSPLQLLAKLSPDSSAVVWKNTYLSRSNRMARAWVITAVVGVLTVFWSLLLVPVAGALNIETIRKVFPQLAEILASHPTAKSLVQTQLPTLIAALLNVTVPYLYEWLSNSQGMISQADVELSLISKNFFFTFFNFFIIFTTLGTASNFLQLFLRFRDSLREPAKIAFALAVSLQELQVFYVNYIILQGLGLFPLKLIEAGSATLFHVYRLGAKTPRDFAELFEPPVFSYGLYIPQTILIFIICIVYSLFRSSWRVLLSGLAYFVLGYFVFKYQLLYAMHHYQHSTGRAWIMTCNRVLLGILLFQLTTAGQLALKGAVKRSFVVVPLLIATVWFWLAYNRTYRPLMNFIALKSIRQSSDDGSEETSNEDSVAAETSVWRDAENGREYQTERSGKNDEGNKFEYPGLTSPKLGFMIIMAEMAAMTATGRRREVAAKTTDYVEKAVENV